MSDSEDLFGKTISDLQENVSISGNKITGSLKYVSDYTGFSSDASLQSGNYLVLHVTPSIEGATVTVTVTNPSTLDSDGIIVLRIADKDTQTVTITATKDDKSVTKVYSLTDLVVATE